MKEASASGVKLASMTPRWDLKVREVAQSSFKQAHFLFTCISDKNQKRSIQELSLLAQATVNEFSNLLTLLDGSTVLLQSDRPKRIKRGPLPLSNVNINPVELMEYSPSNSSGSNDIRQFLPLQTIQSTNSLIPSNTFNLTNANVIRSANPFSLNPVSTSFLSLDNGNKIRSSSSSSFHYSSSEIVGFRYDDSKCKSSGLKSGETSTSTNTKCLASTGGCHCSKRRKFRIKKIIQVPANLTGKLTDIPQDDYTWRKYGQKPIKGSPFPRSYYKCSSMRSCPARKHVERCLQDPTMLVVTYEGEHCHSKIPFQSPNLIIQV